MSQEKGNDSKEGDEQNHKSDEIRLAKHLPNVSRVSGTLLIGVETIFGAFKILLIPKPVQICDQSFRVFLQYSPKTIITSFSESNNLNLSA